MLELWDRVPDAAVRAGVDAAALHYETVLHLRSRDGLDTSRALRLTRRGLALATDPVLKARLHGQAASTLGNQGQVGESIAHLEAGRALLDRDDPPQRTARALPLSLWSFLPVSLAGGEARRRQLVDEALMLVERGGDLRSRTVVVVNSTGYAVERGEAEDALRRLRILQREDLPTVDRLQTVISETDALLHLGAFDEAVEVGEAALVLADRIGLERGYGAPIAANVAEADLARGRAEPAVVRLERLIDLLRGIPAFRSFAIRTLAVHLVWDDRLAAARAVACRDPELVQLMTAEDLEERMGWAEYEAELPLGELEDERLATARSALAGRALSSCMLLGDQDFISSPGNARRLLPAAARAITVATREEADAPSAGRDRRTAAGRRWRTRRDLFADSPGTAGTGAGGRGSDQLPDREAAVHLAQDRVSARLGNSRQDRSGQPHRGRRVVPRRPPPVTTLPAPVADRAPARMCATATPVGSARSAGAGPA